MRSVQLLTILLASFTPVVVFAGESKGKHEPAPKRVIVPKLQASINSDGKLEEPVWKEAVKIGPFLLNDGSREGTERTEVRLWYDNQALHIGWVCVDSDIQATFKERDSRFWEEEVVEFFVTAGRLEQYYELQWNPLGGVFDAVISNELDDAGISKKFEGDWDYTAQGMRSAVFVQGTISDARDRDRQWSVEVSVPFSDLQEKPPRSGDVWRANFYRFNRGKDLGVELLSWSPTRLPSFHQPSRFGYLEF